MSIAVQHPDRAAAAGRSVASWWQPAARRRPAPLSPASAPALAAVGRSRRRAGWLPVALAAAVALTASLPAAAAETPRLEPLPTVRALAVAPPDTVAGLVDAALVLSGRDVGDLEPYRTRFLAVAEAAAAAVAGVEDPAERAELVLGFMHEQLLTTYHERQTRLDTLITDGTYNCVSSAVAYMVLNRAAGLQTAGVRTSDHAFCRVLLDETEIDVETTNAYGFDPGKRREFTDAFGQTTGYSYVPANQDPHRRETNQIGLLALILHNRVAFAGERDDHLGAIGPAVDLFTLTPDDEDARDVLYLALSNVGAHYGQRNQFDTGLSVLDAAVQRYGANPRLHKVRRDLFYNHVVVTLQHGDAAGALELLARGREQQVIEPAAWADLSVGAYQQDAHRLAGQGAFLDAAARIEEALAAFPRRADLLGNFEAYLHNHFVQLVNANDLAEAARFLLAALERYPESRLLAEDKSKLDAMTRPR